MTRIYCLTTDKGRQTFYLDACGETHYLFTQDYRHGVKDYFGRGVCVDNALDVSRARNDSAIIRTMRKLPLYIRYIEKEYGITVLRSTARRAAHAR